MQHLKLTDLSYHLSRLQFYLLPINPGRNALCAFMDTAQVPLPCSSAFWQFILPFLTTLHYQCFCYLLILILHFCSLPISSYHICFLREDMVIQTLKSHPLVGQTYILFILLSEVATAIHILCQTKVSNLYSAIRVQPNGV